LDGEPANDRERHKRREKCDVRFIFKAHESGLAFATAL
jgi:hypothetical protein